MWFKYVLFFPLAFFTEAFLNPRLYCRLCTCTMYGGTWPRAQVRTEILLPSPHHALHHGSANMLAVAMLVKTLCCVLFRH